MHSVIELVGVKQKDRFVTLLLLGHWLRYMEPGMGLISITPGHHAIAVRLVQQFSNNNHSRISIDGEMGTPHLSNVLRNPGHE